jgi:hypothetical protein
MHYSLHAIDTSKYEYEIRLSDNYETSAKIIFTVCKDVNEIQVINHLSNHSFKVYRNEILEVDWREGF